MAPLENLTSRWPALAKWARGPGSCIGLDVGSTSVKGVMLTRDPNGLKLPRRAVASIPPGNDPAPRVQAIRQVLQELGNREVRVVTAVGGQGVVLRSILLPKMTAEELRTAISFEAEKYIPFKPEEAYLDFSVVGNNAESRMEVLLAAARKELVNAHQELLLSAEVTPHVVDLEALALANAWEINHPVEEQGEILLIHLGARGTVLDFFRDSRLQFTRDIPIGGDAFTQALASGLQLDAAEAEKIKCHPEVRAKEICALLQPLWEEWLAQCRVSLDFYESQFGHRVERLSFSGGSARLIGFREWVQEATGLPTGEWNPVASLLVEGDLPQLAEQRIVLGVAVGLAVRELV